jgi:hexosaminidase
LAIFHVGGDEVPKGSWEGSELAMNFMAENGMTEIYDLKDYFLEQILNMFEPRGIQLAGWEEIVMRRNGMVRERFVGRNVLSYCWNTIPDWGGDELPYRLANAGYPIILSNVGNFYMDLAYASHPEENGLSWGGYVNEYNSFDMLPFNIYKSLRRDTRGNPIDIHNITKLPLNEDARRLIKGLQVQLWAETIRSFEQIEYYIFPKMFGLIERAWNMVPAWSMPYCDDAYMEALRQYNAKLAMHELPRLKRMGANFRVAPPGIIVRDGMLHANKTIPNAVIRYTTDGSIPTANSPIWTEPIAVDAELIMAKTFYLGKESVTIRLRN